MIGAGDSARPPVPPPPAVTPTRMWVVVVTCAGDVVDVAGTYASAEQARAVVEPRNLAQRGGPVFGEIHPLRWSIPTDRDDFLAGLAAREVARLINSEMRERCR